MLPKLCSMLSDKPMLTDTSMRTSIFMLVDILDMLIYITYAFLFDSIYIDLCPQFFSYFSLFYFFFYVVFDLNVFN